MRRESFAISFCCYWYGSIHGGTKSVEGRKRATEENREQLVFFLCFRSVDVLCAVASVLFFGGRRRGGALIRERQAVGGGSWRMKSGGVRLPSGGGRQFHT